jgi:magnesium transporter
MEHASSAAYDLRKSDAEAARNFLEREHPADAAAALAELTPGEVWEFLRPVEVDRQAAIFGYLPGELQLDLSQVIPRAELAAIVTEMDSDERADLFNRMEEADQQILLRALARVEREDIRRLAAHAEGTAGSIMTTDYAVLTPELTVNSAIDRLRRVAPEIETMNRAWVVDRDRRLIGSVRLQQLILAAPRARIRDIMEERTHAVRVDDDQEDAAQQLARYDMVALPVVDHEGRLVGIITHDDAMDVLTQEATEDFHKVGTVGILPVNVRDATITLLYQKRVTWLVLLVFGNIFSGAGIAYFEDTIAAHMALLFFLPLLIASSGNAGAQASTMMVRALATGDVVIKDWGRMLVREILVATALGLTMAFAVSWIGLIRGGPDIALVVALTMVAVVLAGSLLGMSLPFLFSRLNMDPATASGPLVTSIADIAGVLIYFSIASAILLTV